MDKNRPNILIISPSSDDFHELIHALSTKDEIRCATSGPQAFAFIEQRLPDLILLEVMISEMDGHEFLRVLRDNPRICDVPVISVTADGSEESELLWLRAGVDDYVTKPFSILTLQLRIHNLIQRRRRCLRRVQQIYELENAHHQSREEHAFLNTLLNTANALVIVIDGEGTIVHFNRAAENFSGYTFEEVNKHPFFWETFLTPDSLESTNKIFSSFLDGKIISRSKYSWCDRGGVRRLFDWNNSTFVNQETGSRYLVMIGTDITEQRLTENALQESLHEYTSLVSMIPLGVYKLRVNKDGDWLFEFVTSKFCDILGVYVGDIYRDAKLLLQKIHEDDRNNFIELHHTSLVNLSKFEWEGRILSTENEIRWIHIESLPSVMSDGDVLWHGIQYDITERKEYEEKLNHIAHYDILTGIPNRRLLSNRMERALLRAQRNHTVVAICYLDLDAFKPVNDQFGHAAGDRLLIEITRRLQNVLRGGDTVARLGGDEFVLVLTDLNHLEESEIVLQRILTTVNTPVAISDSSVTVSGSIGVTFYPQDNSDVDALLRHADHAMYQAKEIGKNCYQFFHHDPDGL